MDLELTRVTRAPSNLLGLVQGRSRTGPDIPDMDRDADIARQRAQFRQLAKEYRARRPNRKRRSTGKAGVLAVVVPITAARKRHPRPLPWHPSQG